MLLAAGAGSAEAVSPVLEAPGLRERQAPRSEAAADTFWFGGTHWNAATSRWEASQNGVWTFDSGVDNNWEGWTVRDLTLLPPPTLPPGNPDNSDFRWTQSALYALYGTPGTNLFPGTTPPDTGAIWCSKYEVEADELCYLDGQGNGNNWEHEARKTFAYGGTGDVRLTYKYFNNTEKNYDFTHLYLEFDGVREATPQATHTGLLGSPAGKRLRTLTVSSASIPAGTSAITAVFHFSADSGWSDEDGHSNTTYGPFCCYSFNYEDLGTPVNNDEDSFEAGPEGWTFVQTPAVGAFVDLTPLSELPPPAVSCPSLQGNVLTFFDKTAGPDDPLHPPKQGAMAMSPRIYLAPTGLDGRLDRKLMFGDVYQDLPLRNGVIYQYWYREYPHVCPTTGALIEAVVRELGDMFWPDIPQCINGWISEEDAEYGPLPIEYFQIGIEALELCSTMTQCTSPGGNTTPWFDNLRVAVVRSTVGVDPAPDAAALPDLTARPNPFRPSVRIEYTVPAAGPVALRIYDVSGALVRTLVDRTMEAGRFGQSWDGLDESGRAMGSGVYWARCSASGREVTRRLVLLR
jgi:hypothetical protein